MGYLDAGPDMRFMAVSALNKEPSEYFAFFSFLGPALVVMPGFFNREENLQAINLGYIVMFHGI